jgi:hypothetical protein
MKALAPIDVLDFDDPLWVTSDWFDRMDAVPAVANEPTLDRSRHVSSSVRSPRTLNSQLRHDEPQVQTRSPPSTFTDDELRDFDVICRIKTPIHAVPDLVNKFDFSWTALAFDDDGIGTFQGVSDKDVDNLPH